MNLDRKLGGICVWLRGGGGWGVGVEDLKVQNITLLQKWFWRFAAQEYALWRTVITAKYRLLNHWTT